MNQPRIREAHSERLRNAFERLVLPRLAVNFHGNRTSQGRDRDDDSLVVAKLHQECCANQREDQRLVEQLALF